LSLYFLSFFNLRLLNRTGTIKKVVCCISFIRYTHNKKGWSWSYGSWIYSYMCNQCPSPLTLWVWIPFNWGILDTTLSDEACQFTLYCPIFSFLCSIL
jgi:hypothetical protein